jgi:hypothetical protein
MAMMMTPKSPLLGLMRKIKLTPSARATAFYFPKDCARSSLELPGNGAKGLALANKNSEEISFFFT